MSLDETIERIFWKGYQYKDMVESLNQYGYPMSITTLKRHLRRLNLGRRKYSSHQDIQEAVQHIQANGGKFYLGIL